MLYPIQSDLDRFYEALCIKFWKIPVDGAPSDQAESFEHIRDAFFHSKYNEVYDFLEFTIDYFGVLRANLTKALNYVLERECAGYRIVSGVVTDIIDDQEIAALEEALQDSHFAGVQAHLQRALELYTDRKNPDYRNSIKESISAVESLCCVITGNDKASLGDALLELENSGKIHGALKSSFSSLYGYTSDADGIRHAMMEEPDLSGADAKFFLLSCTSFTNYLKTKMD